jgi:hypothetical protein
MSDRPLPPVVTSGPPPAGTVTLKGAGWRVNLPAVVVAGLLSALATRLASTELRAFEQQRTIESLSTTLRECNASVRQKALTP